MQDKSTLHLPRSLYNNVKRSGFQQLQHTESKHCVRNRSPAHP
nr:MAG TPA: hypothetical protein [Caudoviricetes sp.]